MSPASWLHFPMYRSYPAPSSNRIWLVKDRILCRWGIVHSLRIPRSLTDRAPVKVISLWFSRRCGHNQPQTLRILEASSKALALASLAAAVAAEAWLGRPSWAWLPEAAAIAAGVGLVEDGTRPGPRRRPSCSSPTRRRLASLSFWAAFSSNSSSSGAPRSRAFSSATSIVRRGRIRGRGVFRWCYGPSR